VIADAPANTLLQQAIAEPDRRKSPVCSIPVPANHERGPMVIHLLPVKGAALDVFSGAEILMAATAVGINAQAPSLSILHGLFDLSPAEARLAAGLVAGHPLRTAAGHQNIQFSTARSYLDNIFRKTGTRQQSQLVALLRSTQPLAVDR
jgi:DNA-binding CsgD family transcriptional regulator